MKTHTRLYFSLIIILSLLLMPMPPPLSGHTQAAEAASISPFVGAWQAIDVDGSDIRLTIGGPPNGPFQITWTESYISFCGGEAGIVRGTGQLSIDDQSILDVDLHLRCFTTGDTLDFQMTFRYHPATNTLSGRYPGGQVIIWHRPGSPVPEPPALHLRTNYGHDWVESFYEDGHTVWITVAGSDGMTVKATATTFTGPQDFWEGVTGFQTASEDWDTAAPDIQPYDWVYAWVDNGASAQVQIGDIQGTIDLADDSIQGTINAPWFDSSVDVECHPWGAPDLTEIRYDTVQPDGVDIYTFSWASVWDIQPGQDVGVWYSGPDGHWVANALTAPNPRIFASQAGDWFWVTEFYPGWLDLSIYESVESSEALWSGQVEAPDLWGITSIGFDIHGQDLVPGNYVVVSDGVNEKGIVLETITMEVFDTGNDLMAGTAPPGRDVWVGAGPQDWQEHILVTADPESGAWLADFTSIEFDITEDMRTWSYAQIFDEDGDANEADPPPPPPNTRFTIFPEWEWFDGMDWPDGALVAISVYGKPECQVTRESWGGFFNGGFPEGCDVAVDDSVTFDDGLTARTHVVRSLVVTSVDQEANTVSGTADPGAEVYVWPHATGEQVMAMAGDDGNWFADFNGLFDLAPNECGRAEIRDELGSSTAVDWCVPPPPRILVQITDDWFQGQYFTPNGVQTYELYDAQEGELLMSGTMQADDQGTASAWVGDQVELAPGNYLVISDGAITKDLVLEALTFDILNLSDGHVEGTAPEPYGRLVWVGIGFADTGWDRLTTTDSSGHWSAEFESAVPVDYEWAAAQVFDSDGDASEVRPGAVLQQP